MRINFGEMFFNRLPEVYRGADEDTSLSPVTPLAKFLSILGAGFDEIESYIDSFENIYDIDQCPAELLDYLFLESGLPAPYDATEKEKRIILRDLPYLIKNKGSKDVLEFVARTMVGDVNAVAERRVDAPANYIDITLYYSTSIDNAEAKIARLERYLEYFRPINHHIALSALPDSYIRYNVERRVTLSYVDTISGSYSETVFASSIALMDEPTILGINGKRRLGTGFRLGYYPHRDTLV